MPVTFMDLSFPFIMDLYRAKSKAEANKDIKAIESLKQHYPELFKEEFDKFITEVKLVALYLDQKYSENFSEIFQPYSEVNLH